MTDKIKTLTMLLLLSTLLAGGQQAFAAEQTIAVIMPGGLPHHQQAHQAFTKALAGAGFGENKAKILVQKPNPDRMSITNSSRRMVAAGADVLVTYGSFATFLAKKEAKKIPLLFADVQGPVQLDIVKNLAAPGVNRSGVSADVAAGDLLDRLLEVKKVQTLGVLYSRIEVGSALQVKSVEGAGQERGVTVLKESVSKKGDLDKALSKLLGQVDCLLLTESLIAQSRAEEIIARALASGTPVISTTPGMASKGALMTLAASPSEQGNLLAVQAIQVLAGKKAFMLSVRTPRKIELEINAGTAKALTMTVPSATLAKAKEVIQP